MEDHCVRQRAQSARRAVQALAGVLSALFLAATVSACGSLGALAGAPATTSASPAATAAPAVAAAAPVDEAGVCIDGTGSSAPRYATDFKAQVAAAVSGWTAAPPGDLAQGADGTPGLHLVLRSVTTDSVATDNSSVNDTIPAVAALAAQPPPSDPNYNDDYRAWLTSSKPDWLDGANAAVAKTRQVTTDVSRYQVVRKTNSGIWSCLAGAVNELGDVPTRDMRLVMMSDLENNEAIVGLALGGARVLLVTVCPADASAGCPQRFAAARSFLLSHGASAVQEISVDAVTPRTLADFWRS